MLCTRWVRDFCRGAYISANRLNSSYTFSWSVAPFTIPRNFYSSCLYFYHWLLPIFLLLPISTFLIVSAVKKRCRHQAPNLHILRFFYTSFIF